MRSFASLGSRAISEICLDSVTNGSVDSSSSAALLLGPSDFWVVGGSGGFVLCSGAGVVGGSTERSRNSFGIGDACDGGAYNSASVGPSLNPPSRPMSLMSAASSEK